PGQLPRLAEMGLDSAGQLRLPGFVKFRDRNRCELANPPVLAGLHEYFENRAAEPVEELPAEPVEARVVSLAQAYQKPEGRGRRVGQAPDGAVQIVLELRQRIDVRGAAGELQNGGDGRHHLVASRLSQQRAVVAQGLVAVAARQI